MTKYVYPKMVFFPVGSLNNWSGMPISENITTQRKRVIPKIRLSINGILRKLVTEVCMNVNKLGSAPPSRISSSSHSS